MAVQLLGPVESALIGFTHKGQNRSDFDPDWFNETIENHGARLAWSRAMKCPCKPANKQTKQPDPMCEICNGSGWRFFGPPDYTVPKAAGSLTRLQREVVSEHGSAVIRGLLLGISNQLEAYTKLGEWTFGTALLTVRPENKVGFYDRLIDLDSTLTFSEILVTKYSGGRAINPTLRYPAIEVNAIYGEDGTRYKHSIDFEHLDSGLVRWKTNKAPADGKRFSIHYNHHAAWRVIEWPHAIRRSQPRPKGRKKSDKTITPLGDPRQLPIQALLRLEHLIERETT